MMYAPNPSGGMMISGSADQRIRVWDMEKRTISGYISVQRPSDKKLIIRAGKEREEGLSEIDEESEGSEL